MKILWICNLILPQIVKALNTAVPYGGGWMASLADDIVTAENVSLSVCFPYSSAIDGTAGKSAILVLTVKIQSTI